ncbi:phosphoribosyltransferase [Nitrosophilus alvini]|uniref:phosphoribosyltransferase n=1 Tax=Nitrosophilus alvini TaxID=2714855 RepID=UPI0019098B68|nr:phosphoribosyltransferase [Nitrosophilus alvini]
MFKDRKDAGKKLAQALMKYRDEKPIVLAIPRGGTEVGFEIAKALDADFSLIICRKLPFPYNPESGFGAVVEDGTVFINRAAAAGLDDEEINRIIEKQFQETKRRIEILRKGKPLPPLENRTVILVDDGIAMGSTMTAAVEMCKKRGARKIVVAVPVAGKRAIEFFRHFADEIIVLESPADFHAVAQVYLNWYDVSDKEVLEIMKKWEEYKIKREKEN